MEEELPEHVRDFKLETRFSRKGQVVHFVHDHNASALSPKVKEYWTLEKASIGRGGQGLVALQACMSGPRKGDRRAVKKIALQDREVKRRYIAELKTNIKFSHDRYSNHFVKTLGWYESSDYLYIAMEYYPAGDLHAYLKEHRLTEEEARQILRGLTLMHEENDAHRDIKPQNVLIQQHPGQGDHSGTWWVKLADFGITKKMGATADFGSTTVIGTEAYMAPELFSESRHPSAGFPAADMWALGIMAYFMLTGEVAFTGRRSLFRYEEQPGTLFPRQTLVDGGVSSNGQEFIRELLHPRARDRPDCAVASHLPWMRDWLASDPVVSDSADPPSRLCTRTKASEATRKDSRRNSRSALLNGLKVR